ncbi:hypothetical protein QJQ45_017924, partial [Haematococcus lacustris]
VNNVCSPSAHHPALPLPLAALRQYDLPPRSKQDLEELVSAVEELPFLSSSSQVEQTSRLLWCFADWAKQPENRRASLTQSQCSAVTALLQRMAVGTGAGHKAGRPPAPPPALQQFDARQLSLAAWSLGKLKPHLPAAAVTSACTAIARHSASSEAIRRADWRDWSNLLHGLATAGMQCSSRPDLTWLCEQAVQLLPEKLAWGAAGQDISMTLWAMAKSGYAGSAQPLLQSITAAIRQGEVMREAEPQQWANLIWAASKLPGCREEARQLLDQFAVRALRVVAGFNAQGVSNILYAMGLVLWYDKEVCRQLAERASQTQQAANGQDQANSLYGLARLGYLDSSVRSLAAGVAKADLAAFTTQAITNLLYTRSTFLALSIHQAVSSGHSQLASEPQLNSMAAALWRECSRRGAVEGQWNDLAYTQLCTASHWLHACTGGQTTLATSPAVRELVDKAAATPTQRTTAGGGLARPGVARVVGGSQGQQQQPLSPATLSPDPDHVTITPTQRTTAGGGSARPEAARVVGGSQGQQQQPLSPATLSPDPDHVTITPTQRTTAGGGSARPEAARVVGGSQGQQQQPLSPATLSPDPDHVTITPTQRTTAGGGTARPEVARVVGGSQGQQQQPLSPATLSPDPDHVTITPTQRTTAGGGSARPEAARVVGGSQGQQQQPLSPATLSPDPDHVTITPTQRTTAGGGTARPEVARVVGGSQGQQQQPLSPATLSPDPDQAAATPTQRTTAGGGTARPEVARVVGGSQGQQQQPLSPATLSPDPDQAAATPTQRTTAGGGLARPEVARVVGGSQGQQQQPLSPATLSPDPDQAAATPTQRTTAGGGSARPEAARVEQVSRAQLKQQPHPAATPKLPTAARGGTAWVEGARELQVESLSSRIPNPGFEAGMEAGGLAQPHKLQALLDWAADSPAQVVFLQECHKAESVWQWAEALSGAKPAWRGQWFYTPGTGSSQGCLVLVKPSTLLKGCTQVQLQAEAAQGRVLRVDGVLAGRPVSLVCVYAPAQQSERSTFFSVCLPACLPPTAEGRLIIMGGDFNCILSPWDRVGVPQGSQHGEAWVGSRGQGAEQLRQLVTERGLVDAWRQLRPPSARDLTHFSERWQTGARLDRWYVSEGLAQWQLDSTILGVRPVPTDHQPVSVSLCPPDPPLTAPAPWQLHPAHLDDPELLDYLKGYLQAEDAHHEAARQLGTQPRDGHRARWARIKQGMALRAQQFLRTKRRARRDLRQRREKAALAARAHLVRQLQLAEQAGQAQVLAAQHLGETTALAGVGERVQVAHQSLLASAVLDQVYGDRSSFFFYHRDQPAHTPTLISSLQLPGQPGLAADLTTPNGVRSACQAFEQHYSAVAPTGVYAAKAIDPAARATLLNCLTSRLTPAQARAAEGPGGDPMLSEEELGRALQGSAHSKAPGLDGLPMEVYDRLWPQLVGPLRAMLREALADTSDPAPLAEFLTGVITLVPKAGKPRDQVAGYRPITLLNCDVRQVARALEDRLQLPLDLLVSPSQSAFILGRDINDSVQFHLGLLEWLQQRHSPAWLLLLDLAGAYDNVSWSLLQDTLEAMGFSQQGHVRWAQLLHRGATSQVLVNGYLTDSFPLASGLLQGSGASPLYWCVVLQPLVSYLSSLQRAGRITTPALPTSPLAMHAATLTPALPTKEYADDLTILVADRVKDGEVVVEALERFRAAGGPALSVSKSVALPCVQPVTSQGEPEALGAEGAGEAAYGGAAAAITAASLPWQPLGLNLLGRVQVAQQCLASKVIYQMAAVQPPTALAHAMALAIKRFVAASDLPQERSPNSNRLYPSEAICVMPRREGGVGLPDLGVISTAMRAKMLAQLWSPRVRPWQPLTHSLLADPRHGLSTWVITDPSAPPLRIITPRLQAHVAALAQLRLFRVVPPESQSFYSEEWLLGPWAHLQLDPQVWGLGTTTLLEFTVRDAKVRLHQLQRVSADALYPPGGGLWPVLWGRRPPREAGVAQGTAVDGGAFRELEERWQASAQQVTAQRAAEEREQQGRDAEELLPEEVQGSQAPRWRDTSARAPPRPSPEQRAAERAERQLEAQQGPRRTGRQPATLQVPPDGTVDELAAATRPGQSCLQVWKELMDPTLRREHAIVAWRVLHGSLMVGALWGHILKGAAAPGSSACRLCQPGQLETLTHAFLTCPAVAPVWEWVLDVYGHLTGTRPPSGDALLLLSGRPTRSEAPPFQPPDSLLWLRLRVAYLGTVWRLRSSGAATALQPQMVAQRVAEEVVLTLSSAVKRDWHRVGRDIRVGLCGAVPSTWFRALRQYDLPPRSKQDLEELVSAVEELPFLSSSSQVEQTSRLLWCFADWAKQPENRRASLTQSQCSAVTALLQRMAVGTGAGHKAGRPPAPPPALQQFDARQLSLAAWSLGKLKPHLPAAAVTSACTAIARHSASSEAIRRADWRDWSNLLHGLATAGMQCSSRPDLTWLCEQAVQLLPEKLAWGAAGQDISMTLWAMAKSGYAGSAQPLLQSITAAIRQGEVMREAEPQQWANLIWAASKLPGCREEARQLLDQFAVRALRVVAGFNAQGVSNILYAMGLVLWYDKEVCRQLAERASQTQQAANGQDQANSLYGLARLGYLDSSVRSLAAGVAKADLAAFTTQAITNLLYTRSTFLALSIHQAVSSGHSQLASEPQLNSMAAALWRECSRRGAVEGQWNDLAYTQLCTASHWLHACTGGQTTLATSPAVRELVDKAAAHHTSIMGALQAALQQSDNSRLVLALAAAGHSEVQQAALSQDGTHCSQLLVQGPGLTRGIAVDQTLNFLPDGCMSGVVAHAKLQQLIHCDAAVVVNKAAFDQLASDSERAAFMREQVRASLPEAEAWRQLLQAEGEHCAGQEGATAATTPAAQQQQAVSVYRVPRPGSSRIIRAATSGTRANQLISRVAELEAQPITHVPWFERNCDGFTKVADSVELAQAIESGKHSNKVVAVEFLAGWCSSCKGSYPALCKLTKDPRLNSNVLFYKANIEEESLFGYVPQPVSWKWQATRQWVKQHEVRGLPHMAVFSPSGELLIGLSSSNKKMAQASLG